MNNLVNYDIKQKPLHTATAVIRRLNPERRNEYHILNRIRDRHAMKYYSSNS